MRKSGFESILRGMAGLALFGACLWAANASGRLQRAPAGEVLDSEIGPLSQIEIDDVNLKPEKRRLLLEDLKRLVDMDFRAEPGSFFERTFGGRSEADINRYLLDRIRYIGEDMDRTESRRDRSGTYAWNFGPTWLDYYYKLHVLNHASARPESAPFKDRRIQILSPRTGLVVLGGAYALSATPIDRVETLIHEARHSDCPRIPSREDLDAYEKSRYDLMTDVGRACTNVHMPCPRGHELAGELACDSHPWGAYMLGWVFADSIFKSCRNCTERERQESLATAAEDLTRLTPELQRGLREGTLPEPDMGSIQ